MAQTIDEYIASFPQEVQERLQTLRKLIEKEVPEAEETIKYDMPTFLWHGNFMYFAAWKKHISVYPVTGAMEKSLPELANYKTSGKGTVQFPMDQPLPLDLVKKMIKVRIKEVEAK